jgi:small basic protein (TIGR04137 family)
MSIDRSLKTANALSRHRNVLNRAERLKKLADTEKWAEGKSVFGLPKVSNRNVKVGKKEKKEKAAEAVAGAPPAGAAPAAAAPAKDAKAGGKGGKK